MKPSANRVFRMTPSRRAYIATVKQSHNRPGRWTPAVRSQSRVQPRDSWWAKHAAPDAREAFMAAAAQRTAEREHHADLAEVRALALGIGLWGSR